MNQNHFPRKIAIDRSPSYENVIGIFLKQNKKKKNLIINIRYVHAKYSYTRSLDTN